jgi:Type I phosphodiesterase / nucleotide pyrophosphatase
MRREARLMQPEERGGGAAAPSSSRSPSLVAALAWGALWAPLLGVWVVVPHFLRTQRIHPSSIEQWALLGSILLIVLVGFGLIGALITWAVLRALSRARRRPLVDPGWTYALCVLLCLPALYFLTAALTELAIFRSLVGLRDYRPFLAPVGGAYAAVCGLFLVLYREIVRRNPRPRLTPIALSGIAALLVGLALAPIWGEPSLDPRANARQLEAMGARPAAPLLFVGVDSGSWKILRPLIDGGKAPTIARLIESGISGEMRAPWPHPIWSAPAWSAILTGYPRRQTGVYQELAASAPDLPSFQIPLELDFLLDPLYLVEYKIAAASGFLRLTPFPRNALLRQPVWELLHDAGLRVAVVRFLFTFPAAGQASFVISDYVGEDIWKRIGVWTQAAGSVAPAAMAPALLSSFSGASRAAEALASGLLPRGGPSVGREALVTPADSLRTAAEIDVRTIDASLHLIRSQPNIDAFFVYLGGFDTVCHSFWRYRFPREFPEDPPGDAAAREFGPVIDRYLEFVDEAIGRLIRAYPRPPNVFVVADHGAEALHGNRTYSGAHSPRDGIFVAAGPDIPHRESLIPVSYYDVAPTALELMGFAPFPDMQGVSRLAAAPGPGSPPGERSSKGS